MARTAEYTTFSAVVSGVEYTFKCWNGSVKNQGGAHFCKDSEGRRTRIVYGNRPWESFRYETVLRHAIRKYPEPIQGELMAAIVDRKQKEAEDSLDLDRFKELHDSLSPENKERLANSGIFIHNAEEAHAVMGLMGLMALMQ